MNSTLRVGIIGAGSIVELAHIPVLKVLAGVNIAWIYDRDPNRSNLLSKMFHIPVLENTSVTDAMDNIDICLLTVPYGARQEYIKLCAEKHTALYVEKPFAVNVNEHTEWLSLFEPGRLAIGFQRRYYESTEMLKTITQKEIFGKLLRIDFSQGYFALKGNKAFLSDAALSGGGVIIESAIHTLDQMLLIAGAINVEVNNVTSLQKKGIDYDTTFRSTIHCAENIIDVTSAVSSLRNLDNGVRFFFKHATLRSNLAPDGKVSIYDNNGVAVELNLAFAAAADKEQMVATTINAAFYYFWRDFLRAIETKTPNYTSAENSLVTTGWIEQIYHQINKTA